MVSGFFTSPCDHCRIFSGLASEMRIALNESGSFGFSKKLKMSFTCPPPSTPEGTPSRWCPPKANVSPKATSRRRRSRLLRGWDRRLLGRGLHQLHVEAERLQLLDEHVERLGQARLERVLTLDDRLVHAGASDHVVGLDGEELLQRVGGAVGLHRPHLHLAQALPAELRLAAQRLLGDQGVRPDAARVDLLVDQVVQLEHVHDAHRDVLVEGLARAPVEEDHLARPGQVGVLELREDLRLARAVEDGRGEVHSAHQLLRQLEQLLVGQPVEQLLHLLRVVDLLEVLADRLRRPLLVDHRLDLLAQAARGPAEVRLEDLPDGHAGRHAQRVQHDVHRPPGLQIRHVLLAHDARDDALVAVPAGHLVAHRQLALDGHVDLDHLDHARGQLVALLEPGDLLAEDELHQLLLLVEVLQDLGDLLLGAADRDLRPVLLRDLVEQRVGHFLALVEQDVALVVDQLGGGLLAVQEPLDPLVRRVLEDLDLVVLVLEELRLFQVLDVLGALVLVDALAAEDLGVDHRALHAGRDPQRAVAHVAGLLAEDGPEQLLLGRELRLALGGDLAHQDRARLHLRADADDARVVQVLERLFTDVRDVARDLFLAQLGVARDALELLDVDRGEHVLLDDALADEDRVLEVVALPRHEGDRHVLAQRQFPGLGGRAVGDDVALPHPVALLHDRLLVDAGVLVGALVLDEVVDVDLARHVVRALLHVGAHHDAGRVHLVDRAVAARHHAHARVARDRRLDAGAHQRRGRAQERHGLALHVRAHQRAVRVVVLQEGDQRSRHRDELVGRHVHQRDVLGARLGELARLAAGDQRGGEVALLVEGGVRLGDDVLLLLERRVELHLVGDPPLDHLAVGRLDEAVLVHAGEGGEAGDEADVRSFRRLDRADAAVVRRVHVAHLEAGALAGQAARSQGREAALVSDLGERVRLVHELRELAGPEELLDHRGHRLGVDQVVRHERLDLLQAHPLLDRALHADQADAVLVLEQLAHRPDAAVAEVVDVVDLALAIFEINQVPDDLEDVLLGEDRLLERLVDGELVVQLEPADLGQVVALGVEEQVDEEVGGRLQRGRIARAQAAVDLHDRLFRRGDLVGHQRVAQERPDVQVVDEEHLELVDAALAQLLDLLLGDLLVALQQDLAGVLVHHVAGADLGDQLLDVEGQRANLRLLQLLDRPAGELAVLLDDHFAGLRVLDVPGGALAGEQLQLDRLLVLALLADGDGLGGVEEVEHLLGGALELDRALLRGVRHRAQRAQQHRRRQLPPPIDADVEDVLVVELEVDPGAAVGDDAGVVEQLARGVALALVVVEERARGAVQLRDHHALGAVDDERAVLRHQRNLAEVDLLLLDVADRLGARLLVLVPDHQAHHHLDRGRVGHAPLVALVDVVLGLLQVVRDELQRAGLVEVLDGKDALEDALEPQVLALLGRRVGLEELVVAVLLDVDQVRDVDDLLDLREVLARTEIVLDRGRHVSDRSLALRTSGDCRKHPSDLPKRKLRHRRGSQGTPAGAGLFRRQISYFSSTVAPAALSCSTNLFASSFDRPSFTVLGAPSTRSLASFRPSPVIARTSLMTLIFFSPAALRTRVNSVFSSTGLAAAAAPPPAAGPAATATGAAAETPHFCSSTFTSSAACMTVSELSDSAIWFKSAIGTVPFNDASRGTQRVELPTTFAAV